MIDEFFKKKIIRDFLSLFSESKCKELIFLLLEYGIIEMRKNYNVASLSLDDINNIVDELKEEETKRMKQNLKKLEKFPKNKSPKSKPSSNWRNSSDKSTDYVKFSNDISNKINRKLAEIESTKKNTSTNIYPQWWNDGTKNMTGNSSTIQRERNKTINSLNNDSLQQRNKDNYTFNKTQGNRSLSNKKIAVKFNSGVSSKIKNRVETDKKIYNLLKNKITQEEAKNYKNNSIYTEGSVTSSKHRGKETIYTASIRHEDNDSYYKENDERYVQTLHSESQDNSYQQSHKQMTHYSNQNYLIEYDKDFNPNIREKNISKTSNLNTDNNYNTHTSKFTDFLQEDVTSSDYTSNKTTNRNEDTYIREQMIQKRRNTNEFNNTNLSGFRTNIITENQTYIPSDRDNEISPHFNTHHIEYGVKHESPISNQNCKIDSSKRNYESYRPFTVQDDCTNRNLKSDDVNESSRLSSYTPSERKSNFL
jgi:hypothetical protein